MGKDAAETVRCLQRFMPSSVKPGRVYTDKLLESIEACNELPWTHDTTTYHRFETGDMHETAVRQVQERTAVNWVQCGLSDER